MRARRRISARWYSPRWRAWCFRDSINYLSKPGHSVWYHALFGVKILLVLHVFSVAILATAPKNPRRARQLFGAAVSGLTIVLISAYLKGIA